MGFFFILVGWQLPVDKVQGSGGGNATMICGNMMSQIRGRAVSVMSIADRIQILRKEKGISQEELAEQVGVSRQAVSKWESEQSSPEVDKIILLSEYFGVTTDYLLKGKETARKEEKKKLDLKVYTIVGTFINVIGLIVAFTIWEECRQTYAVAIGLIWMAAGCTWYFLGVAFGEASELGRRRIKRKFWMINIWILAIIPYTFCFNVLNGLLGGFYWQISPYPEIGNSKSLGIYILGWLFYFALCGGFDLIVGRKNV